MVDQHTTGGDEDRAGLSASTDAPMSRVHAHARTHEAAPDPFAEFCRRRWSAQPNPETGRFTADEAREVFEAGRASAIAERAIADVSQTVALSAIGLLTEAARLFRHYEAHHRAKAATAEALDMRVNDHRLAADSLAKADRNAGMADRIESFLADPTTPRDTLTGLALSLVQDLDDLIQHSEGVAGLHMNGDVADWGSLTAGGTFEAWLASYDRLRDALDEQFPGVDAKAERAAATVRTIEAAVAGGLIPGIDEDRLSLARVEARLFGDGKSSVEIVGEAITLTNAPGMDPEVVDALRQTHDGA